MKRITNDKVRLEMLKHEKVNQHDSDYLMIDARFNLQELTSILAVDACFYALRLG